MRLDAMTWAATAGVRVVWAAGLCLAGMGAVAVAAAPSTMRVTTTRSSATQSSVAVSGPAHATTAPAVAPPAAAMAAAATTEPATTAPIAIGLMSPVQAEEDRFRPAPKPPKEPAGEALYPPDPGAAVPGAGAETTSKQITTAEDGQWTMPGKNVQGWRYSGLDEINTENASKLTVKWTFSTGVNRGQEAAPLMVGKTVYVITPYPDYVYALELTGKADDPYHLKWKFEPKPQAASQGVACCDVVNRGLTFDDGKIFLNTLDCQTICLKADTGEQVWRRKWGDINLGESCTMAPLVVKGKVFAGVSGGEFGVRGRITAMNESDGSVAWVGYTTGPDKDVLIGDEYKPFYEAEKGKDLGITTWPPGRWKIGGGAVWGWVTYDPDTDLIFYGTSNPGSWNPELRPGANKFACGGFARRPETGQAVWYYQYSPHDLYDHDAINEHVVLDLPIGGKVRKCVVHPGRNGFMYVMDRTDGEVISATPFVRITAEKGVDLKTGRLIPNVEKEPHVGVVVRDVMPASPGAKDWQPSAWSPRTGLLYVPHQNLACDYEATEANYIAGTPYVGVNEKMYAGPEGNRGWFTAWDPVACRAAWRITEDLPVWSGACVTAGDVVFYGTMDGWFKCLNAKDGKLLWKFKTGSGIIGQPTTWKGPDGKQYVSVLSGVGGWSGVVVAASLDVRDPTAALGFVNAMKDLPQKTTKGGTLYVFGLP